MPEYLEWVMIASILAGLAVFVLGSWWLQYGPPNQDRQPRHNPPDRLCHRCGFPEGGGLCVCRFIDPNI